MPDAREITLTFEGGSARVDELQVTLRDIIQAFSDPESDVVEASRAQGLDVADIVGAGVRVEQQAAGFGVETVVIVLLLKKAADVLEHIADQVSDDIIYPRIKSALGADALGDKSEPTEIGGSEEK